MKRIKRKHWKDVLERLEALEWVVKELHAEAAQEPRGHDCCHGHDHHHARHHHHGHHHPCHCRCGCGDRGRNEQHDGKFDEKRVVDLIVTLLSERLDRTLAPLLERLGAVRPKRERLDERQIVDRVVRLVSERVEQLVVERLGQVMDSQRGAAPADPGGGEAQ